MPKIWGLLQSKIRLILGLSIILALLYWLLINKLGTLAGGLGPTEVKAAGDPVGWHGIYHHPLYLPLKIVRSVVFAWVPSHGALLTRLPNAIFGGLTIVTFSLTVRLWHGNRTALLTGLLFATSAWVLHVSRLASYDVLYLWAVPTLLLINVAAHRYNHNKLVWYGSLITLVLMLYVPGLVWLLLAAAYFMRSSLLSGWRYFNKIWQRGLAIFILLAGLPLLVADLLRAGQFKLWLGLPARFAGISTFRHLLAVPYHLIGRGPLYPEIWLGRAPVLDIFALLASLIGIYFYATHIKAKRSHLLASFLILGWLLVGIGGPVGLSLLVPIMYLVAATGIAYLLHEWLHVFPLNPLARGLGIGLISLVVGMACIYNLRAYFVAWPHDPATRAVFSYRL